MAEAVQHDVFGFALAARTRGIGVVDVRAVTATVRRDAEHAALAGALHLRRRRRQGPGARGTGLGNHRPGDAVRAEQPGQPGAAVQAAFLRHGQAEHDAVEHRSGDVAFLQRDARRSRGQRDGVDGRQAALPLAERRAPVAAVGDEGLLESHESLLETMKHPPIPAVMNSLARISHRAPADPAGLLVSLGLCEYPRP
jgi:hypothetical protein